MIANARKNQVLEEEGRLKVRVTAPAVGGKANKAVIKLLAGHLGVKKSAITIVQGLRSRHKVIAVR